MDATLPTNTPKISGHPDWVLWLHTRLVQFLYSAEAFRVACQIQDLRKIARLSLRVDPSVRIKAFSGAIRHRQVGLAKVLWQEVRAHLKPFVWDGWLAQAIEAQDGVLFEHLLAWMDQAPSLQKGVLGWAIGASVHRQRWDLFGRLLTIHLKQGLAALPEVYESALFRAWEIRSPWVPRLWPHTPLNCRVALVQGALNNRKEEQLGPWLDAATCEAVLGQVLTRARNLPQIYRKMARCAPLDAPGVAAFRSLCADEQCQWIRNDQSWLYEKVDRLVPWVPPEALRHWLTQVPSDQVPMMMTAARAHQLAKRGASTTFQPRKRA